MKKHFYLILLILATALNGDCQMFSLDESFYPHYNLSYMGGEVMDIYEEEDGSPIEAHLREGELKRRWKNYYSKKKEVVMT